MKNIGVIGNGFVGNSIYHTFSPQFNVKVYDKNPARSTHTLVKTLLESDVIFLCLPTPMKPTGEMDISYIEKSITQIKNTFIEMDVDSDDINDKVFVIKSTVVPSTTSRLADESGLNIIFSPEFLTERTAVSDSICSNHVILGGTIDATLYVGDIYQERFGDGYKIIYTDSKTAEFIKYMRNTFFATKVTFMNELYRIAINSQVD